MEACQKFAARLLSKRNGERFKLNLSQYRAKDPLELTMKAVFVAPRVFEIDNFLSDI